MIKNRLTINTTLLKIKYFLFLLFFTSVSWGQLVTYTPTALGVLPTNTKTPAANITANTLATGGGFTSGACTSGSYFHGTGVNVPTSTATAATAGTYYEFTVAANSGYSATYTSVSISNVRNSSSSTVPLFKFSYKIGSGPFNDDPGNASGGTGNCTSTGNTYTYDFTDFSSTQTITFRIYIYNGAASNTSYRFTTITVNGSVTTSCSTPTTPTCSTPAAICQGSTTTITGSGSTNALTYTYWDAASGGNQYTNGVNGYTVTSTDLTTPSSLASTTTYYVQGENGSCLSASRQAVTVTVTTAVTQAVSSAAASSVTTTSASVNGSVTTLGVCPATTQKGFVYSLTSANATPINGGAGVTTASVAGLATGAYTLGLSGLPTGTTYSYRAYVFDGTTYVYGTVLTFTTASLSAPALTATTSPTSVDNTFTVTFPADSAYTTAIGTGTITINGVTLTAGTDYSVSGNTITFTPSVGGNASIHTPGTYTITVNATGYSTATVSQTLTVGVATKLVITTQPTAPATNGAVLGTQPVVTITDQYGNLTTSTAAVTATTSGGTWTVGGGTNPVSGISGTATFAGLTATSAAAVPAATITFTSPGLTSVISNSFAIPSPPPANDTCSGAIAITIDAAAVTGTLANATPTAGNTFTYPSNPSTKNDVWYSFTPTCSGSHTISVAWLTSSDLDFDVFTGPTCPTTGAAPVISHGSSNPEATTAVFTAGTIYYIRILDFNTNAAAFTISVVKAAAVVPAVTTASVSGTTGTVLSYNIIATNTPGSYALVSGSLPPGLALNTTTGAITGTPTTGGTYVVTVSATNCAGTSAAATLTFTILNDLCTGATTLTVNAAATSGNMTGATYTTPFTSNKDVWYTFTPSCTASHSVTVTGFSGDIDIELYSGSCPASTTYLFNSSGTTSTETITTTLTAGTVYYLRVLAYSVAAQTTAFTAQVTTASAVVLSNTGSPAAGNISAGTSTAVIMGFTVVPNCGTTYNLTAVTITKSGTTTTADLSNFKIYYDANGNGVVDGGESAISGAGIALATSMAFTLSGQTGLTGTRNYLLVADASASAVNGHTILASIASSSNATASVSLSGTAVGNTQTITPATCTAAVLSSITPASGPVGTEVTITASSGNLTGATVKFNGITATIVSTSATKVVALVPTGATTGTVTVTDSTPCNASTSFTVLTKDITSCQGGNTATDLFMSEVTDSNFGSLTYVEIYNGTNAAVNLSSYAVKTANNGSGTLISVALNNVSLASGGVYVLSLGSDGSCSNYGSDGSLANQASPSASVNFDTAKNDFIGLYKSGTLIDSWGTYLSNNWADLLALGIGTEGADFRRKSTATLPNTTFSSADWTVTDYAGAVCANNDYTNIGSYSFTTASAPTITTNPTYSPTCKAGSLTVAGTEGYVGGNALAYQWYVATVGASTWTALTDTGVYTGSTTATLSMSNVSTLIGNQYYCQILENTGTCYTASNAVKVSDSTITWNGTNWLDVNGAITATSLSRPAVLNANYDTTTNGSFDACSLVVNAGITATIKANTYINIQNDLTVNATATLSVENNGSLVQIDDTGVNTGSIAMQRTANIRKTDYVYWSTPVASFAVNSISPTSNYIYKWNATVANSNNGQGDWQSASGNTMTTGVGYIVRGPSANSTTTPSDYTATFTGVPNNGVVNVPINRGSYTGADYHPTSNINTTITNYDDNMNLIGNPYPSAIKALDFLNANASIEGSVQIWTHGTQLSNAIASPFYGNFAYNYTSADYITYNGTGTTSGPTGFNGYIGAGQGFFVKMLDGATASGTVTFNNALRNKTHSNSQFYRIRNPQIVEPTITDTNTIDERHRIWLDLLAPTGAVIRTMVGYVTGATIDKDRLYDAYSDYENDQNFFSLIGKEIMTIQGRPVPFDVNDTVPMGVAIPKTGNYTIAIGAVDGLFEGGQQTIYIEDKLLNVIHNLTVNPYSFNIDKGIIKDRFVLRYTDRALGTIDFKALNNSVVVASQSNQITIKSFIEEIKNIVIYDVLGREVFAKNNVNAMEFLAKDLNLSQQALLVKITLTNGQTVVKKIVY
jgi:hypothetical protein